MTDRRIAGCLVFAATISASIAGGAPSQSEMPQIALGWAVLLHVERAVAMIGLVALIGLVWWRASRGELPIRFGNIEYEAEDTAAEVRGILSSQEERILYLERALALRDKQVADHRDEA